ncbi:MAG: SDR family NAD(P)-dependent oxidoreductase [Alphaproteobacteria bacterium]|jgi:short-subunit dehydrogenase|nr:SDR family NAD(P)-dependent oxidoreductase [Alphaproteobacteria bacterium]
MPTILITGASSGIGAALARRYAAPGTTLFLLGRDEKRLAEAAHSAAMLGAKAQAVCADVTNAAEMAQKLIELDKESPIDLVIANAGISAGTGGGQETREQVLAIFRTNVDGVFNTIQPLIPLMKARGRGQIALMASLAGFRGLAGAPAYMASKAAVRVYGEGLRGELAPFGVAVSVICPGFVKTPMTEVNRFKMPFLISADRAGHIIKNGLEKNRPRISFPWPMVFLVWGMTTLPVAWTDGLLNRLPRKGSCG